MRALARYRSWLERLSKRRSRQGLYEFLCREYGAIPRGSKVLSIGAGGHVNELLDRFAAANELTVVSMDVDPGRQPMLVGDLCRAPLADRVFDVVVAAEVLEHLHSPADGLGNVRRVLREGGRLILSTPFILPMHDRPHDYFRFTAHGLELLLRDYRDVRVSRRDSYFEAIDVLWLRLLQTELRSARLLSLFLVPIVFFLKRPFTLLLGRLCGSDAMTTGYVVHATR